MRTIKSFDGKTDVPLNLLRFGEVSESELGVIDDCIGVFSVFVRSMSGAASLRFKLTSDVITKVRSVQVNNAWQRFEIDLESTEKIGLVKLNYSLQAASEILVAFAGVQLEAGRLYASSPIPKQLDGQYRRAADILKLPLNELGNFNLDSFTVFFIGEPASPPHLLRDEFLTCFAFVSEKTGYAIAIGVSGKDAGKIAIRETIDGKHILHTGSAAYSGDKLTIIVSFSDLKVSMLVNGSSVVVADLETEKLLVDQYYIGCVNSKGERWS